MKRLSLPVVLLLVSFLLVSPLFGQNKKLDKSLKKVSSRYNQGSLPKAIKELKKFKERALKEAAETGYMVSVFVWESRLHLASGNLKALDESLNNALASSEKVYGPTSNSFATTLIEVGEIYNEYGNYRRALEYLQRAQSILEKSGNLDNAFKARLALNISEALTGQGFYRRAIEGLREVEPFLAARAVEKETYVEGDAIKTRRVPSDQLIQRFEEYGRLLMLIGYSYGKQGNLVSMDSVFLMADPWFKKNLRYLGETSVLPVEAHFLHAKMLAENNNGLVPEKVESYNQLDNILSDYKKRASPTSALAHEIYLAYLGELMQKEYNSRFYNVKAEYEKVLNKYFDKKSVVHANLSAVEFSKKLQKDNTRNLESAALAMLNSREVPANYRTTERVLEFLTQVALAEKHYGNAENFLKQIIDIRKELCGEGTPEYNLARIYLANFYLDYTNNIELAGKLFEEAYYQSVAKEIGPWQKDHLNILSHLAKYYEVTDQYALANKTLDQAAKVANAKYDKDDPDFAVALDYMAQLQIKIGEYEKAESNITKALKILEEHRKDERRVPEFVHAIETQAKLYGIQGLFDEAESNLDRSSKIIRKSEVSIAGETSSTEELAALYIQLGRFSEADQLLSKQIPELEELFGPETLRLIEPLVNKGRIYLAKGDYTEAERIARRANRIAVKTYGDNSTKTAPTQKLLADIHYTLGDFDKAEADIVKALASQEKQFGRNHIEVAKSISQLALIKFYKGDSRQQVEKLMLEAKDIMAAKLGVGNPQYAEIMKNVAVLYISEKKYDIAFNSLTVAEKIWREKTGKKNNINAASIFTLTGDVYYQQRNYKKADEFYNKSKDLYEKFFSIKHPEYVKALSKLAKVRYMQKEYKQAKRLIEECLANYEDFIKLYFPALSEVEKAKYWNTIKSDFEFYNTLAFGNLDDFRDLTGKVYNYQLLTKALLLSSSIKIRERILSSTDTELKEQYNAWIAKKELLTVALSMSTQQLAENAIDPNALQQEVERLEKDLSQRSEIFGQSFENKRITFEDVKKSLKPNEVAIEMVRYRYFNHTFTDSVIYAGLYIKRDQSKPRAVIFDDGAKMEGRYFKFYRNAIIGRVQDQNSYNVYWKKMADEVGQTSTLYLSADGIYNQINLESIPTPDGRYIIDNSNIVLVSNTKDIYLRTVKTVAREKQNTATMFGNPTFYSAASSSGSITPLPGTEKEVTQVQYLLKEKGWITSEFVSDYAAEERIKELNSPKIFHIATHGLYQPSTVLTMEKEMEQNEAMLAHNPLMRTGLLLKGAGDLLQKTRYNYNIENGILTAYEAMSLNLDKTDLVVLSACETGLGDLQAGEGVYGLQRAFLVAGAKVLIMSMFKVDDDATQKLMLKFYQKWLNSGSMRSSFVEAKKELRSEYPDPIHWGAFMMIGIE